MDRYGGSTYARTMGLRVRVPARPRKRPPTTRVGQPARMGRRVRRRVRTRGFTATRRRQRRRFARAQKRGENSSASTVSIGRRWLGKKFRSLAGLSGKKTLSYSSSSGVDSTSGHQACFVVPYMDRTDLQALNKEANSGAAAVSANLVTYLMRYVKQVLVLKNQSNHVVKMQIFDLVCKQMPTGSSLDDPLECWSKHYTDLGSTATRTDVGNSPLRSLDFLRAFSVKRVITHDVEPGEQHTHTLYHAYNRLFRDFDMAQQSTDSRPYVTGYIMVVFYGSLGHESTTVTNVNYMPARMDYAIRKEIVFQHAVQTQPNYAYTNTLPAVTNYDFMGENQDIDLDPTSA